MNYKDLMQKLAAIEEGKQVNEMGIPLPGIIAQAIHPEQPQQQDSVTMNVSMNGSGSGGIKDLMDILRAIEHGDAEVGHDHGAEVHPDTHGDLGNAIFGDPEMHDEPLFGSEDGEMEETMGDDGERFGNSAHGGSGTHVHGIDAVTPTGDDLLKGTKGIPQYSPGNNTLTVKEGLIEKLGHLYNEVKTRDVVNENVHLDETGATFSHILHTYKRDVMDFEQGGELSDSLYDALYDYYFDDMPYGVKKARDGDPYEWIGDRFADDLGISETVALNQIQGAGAGD
jgi:flagellin-specific chaperone FliS